MNGAEGISRIFNTLMHAAEALTKTKLLQQIFTSDINEGCGEKLQNIKNAAGDKKFEESLEVTLFIVQSFSKALNEKGETIANRKIKKEGIAAAYALIEAARSFISELKRKALKMNDSRAGLSKDELLYTFGDEKINSDTIDKLEQAINDLAENKYINPPMQFEAVQPMSYSGVPLADLILNISSMRVQLFVQKIDRLSKEQYIEAIENTLQEMWSSLPKKNSAGAIEEEYDVAKIHTLSEDISSLLQSIHKIFMGGINDQNTQNRQLLFKVGLNFLYEFDVKMKELQSHLEHPYASELTQVEKDDVQGLLNQHKEQMKAVFKNKETQKMIAAIEKGDESVTGISSIKSATANLYKAVLPSAERHQNHYVVWQMNRKLASVAQGSDIDPIITYILDNVQEKIIKKDDNVSHQIDLPGILQSLQGLSKALKTLLQKNDKQELTLYKILSLQLDYQIIPELQEVMSHITFQNKMIVLAVGQYERWYGIHEPIKDLRGILDFAVYSVQCLLATEGYIRIRERIVGIGNEIQEKQRLAGLAKHEQDGGKLLMQGYSEIISDLISRNDFNSILEQEEISEEAKEALVALRDFIGQIQGKRLQEIGGLINDQDKFQELQNKLQEFIKKVDEKCAPSKTLKVAGSTLSYMGDYLSMNR